MKYKMFRKSFSVSKEVYDDQKKEECSLENSVLKSKLNSKIEALAIMSKELDKCAMERDKYKLLVEQMSNFKLQDENIKMSKARKSVNGGDLLAATRSENFTLKIEVEALKSRLEEVSRDMAAMRVQLQNRDGEQTLRNSVSKTDELLINHLEKLRKKYNQLKQDYNSTLDEKEELMSDRDYYKDMLKSINKQLSNMKHTKISPSKEIVEKDRNSAECQTCKLSFEKIVQLEIENEMIKRNYYIFRENYEARRKYGRFNYSFEKLELETQNQVRRYIQQICATGDRRLNAKNLALLCLNLMDTLSDKCYVLTHHKKCNRLLASRIFELEKTIQSLLRGEQALPFFPSKLILEEFCPEFVGPMLHSDSNVETLQEISEQDLDYTSDENDSTLQSISCYEDGKVRLPTNLEAMVQKALTELNKN